MLKKYFIATFLFFVYFGCAAAPSNENNNPSQTSHPPYSVKLNNTSISVERVSKFDVPISYVRFDWTGSNSEIEITINLSFDSYSIHPLSRNITSTRNGNKIKFTITEPNYLILQVKSGNRLLERLFILVDPPEDNPPKLGDANVTNIMSYAGIDNTGQHDVTTIIQNAINQASGASRNIIYFPAGRYKIKYLNMKDNVTLYLADGAIFECAMTKEELNTHLPGYVVIEGCSHAFIHFKNVRNAKLIGRGTIDANGKALRNPQKMYSIKFEESSNCIVEGIISRDSCFWNTLIYRSSSVVISNYKVINNRLERNWNETDGVNFDNCIDGLLYNAFLWTGDDSMAVKSDDIIDGFGYGTDPTTNLNYMNVSNIVHRKIVSYGQGGCKVGTKTYGNYMVDIVYDDIDIIGPMRGLVIDGVDTANISRVIFKNIRIESVTGRLIDINIDVENIFWRTALGLCNISNIIISNVHANMKRECRLVGTDHGWITDPNHIAYGKTNYIQDIKFYDFVILGNKITSLEDPNAEFTTNAYVRDIFFY